MPTPEQIQIIKDKVLEEKARLPEFSAFGDPNHRINDYMVEVLDGRITDEDEVYDLEDELGEGNHSSVLECLQFMNDEVSFDDMIENF